MFIFIHDVGETKSLYVHLIRKFLNLSKEHTDKQILSYFLFDLPGHPYNDQDFKLNDLRQMIFDFQERSLQFQLNLAKKLILTHSVEFIQGLKSTKIILIGFGGSGVFCLDFALHYPKDVGKIISFSTQTKINRLSLNLRNYQDHSLDKTSIKKLVKIYKQTKNLKQKIKLSIFLENHQRRAYFQAMKLVKNYNLIKTFNNLHRDDQENFKKIPIFWIDSKMDFLSKYSRIKRFQIALAEGKTQNKDTQKIFNIKSNICKYLKTINLNFKTNFHLKTCNFNLEKYTGIEKLTQSFQSFLATKQIPVSRN